jgi:hypothetical protein
MSDDLSSNSDPKHGEVNCLAIGICPEPPPPERRYPEGSREGNQGEEGEGPGKGRRKTKRQPMSARGELRLTAIAGKIRNGLM